MVLNNRVIDLGCYSLSRKLSLGKMGDVSHKGGGMPLYKQILSKMPKELRDSLVCWYSPNLQGLTNAELYDSNNEYIGGLHDLSGNGHDMDLHGFLGVEGDGHVDADGNLCFDGLNDWAWNKAIEAINGDNTFIAQSVGQEKQELIISTSIAVNTGTMIWYQQALWLNGIKQKSDITEVDDDILVLRYNANNEKSGMGIGRIRPTDARGTSSILLKSIVRFNKTLTDSEIEWVKTNMLVSQEPSKRNVTLWLVDEESGSFDKFKTLRVQNGNMVGKYDEDDNLVLPIYDIDAIHQTSMTWYTDVECTEEYSGEYITEDTFLYAKKVRTSDNMLIQLDNVILEDGTTAREHLVCWYSPKLQGLTKESVLTDATLADLSGNGCDMTLYGFTEDETIIDADGALMFDGVDDYGSRVTKVVNNPTILCYYQLNSKYAFKRSNTIHVLISGGKNNIVYGSSKLLSTEKEGLAILKKDRLSINNKSITIVEDATTANNITIGGVSSSNSANVKVSLYIEFDATLSDTEIEQVKTILKLQ